MSIILLKERIYDCIYIAPQPLRKLVDKFILRNSYYYAEKFAKQENFIFPSAKEILRRFKIN